MSRVEKRNSPLPSSATKLARTREPRAGARTARAVDGDLELGARRAGAPGGAGAFHATGVHRRGINYAAGPRVTGGRVPARQVRDRRGVRNPDRRPS